MNLASQAGDDQSDLLFVNFNQDCTSVAVGTKTGYKLSLVAIVSLSSPRKLKVCHFKKGTEICNYSYSNSILAVKLNRQRLIVCLEESLYIHNIRDMKVLHTIRDTPPNPNGLCALSISNDNSFLAYPGSNTIGEVQIFDTINLRAVAMIPAHDNPLAAIAFNAQGTKIATASEKGTVIRVFSIPDGQKICVHIYALAFSSDSTYLCASSNTETVHVFKLETQKESGKSQEEQSSWMGYFSKALKDSATYLPSPVTDMFNQGRAFAICKLPSQGLKNKVPRLLVASADGYLYIYNLDPNDGGECMLLRQHSLDGRMSEGGTVSEPPSVSGDRPLTQVSNPVSYAGLVRRPDSSTENTPPPQHTGKLRSSPPVSPSDLQPSTSPWRLESYATILNQGHGGPQLVGSQEGVTEIDIILDGRDSQPFQEFEQGAMGHDVVGTAGLNALRLDDDNEFPPMTHKVD
ncbi:WIPI2-like protein [Mya arenaria]|uniref:WIPI2-like protein n=1 Tax=Mya arenaria TaxID=6604 RepID=A0ABY7DH41_MYAAR|nr:WIPI2-like protein [Mya arenaria]WAQ97002.1 WIPI2-like protein [Mya arenaria]